MTERFQYGLNMAFTSAVIAAQTGTATVDTTTAVQACVKGVFIAALGALTNQALVPVSSLDGTTTITFKTLLNHQACVFIHCVNAAGEYKTLQGPIAELDASDTLIGAIEFGNVPDTLTPFGYTKVVAAAAATSFIPGTTNWDATGITSTAVNVSVLPTRPLS